MIDRDPIQLKLQRSASAVIDNSISGLQCQQYVIIHYSATTLEFAEIHAPVLIHNLPAAASHQVWQAGSKFNIHNFAELYVC